MLVVVDANVLLKDPLLRNNKWLTAKQAIFEGHLAITLPEIARMEVIAGYRRNHEERIEQLNALCRRSTKRAKEAAAPLIEVYRDEIEGYDDLLSGRLLDIGIKTATPPPIAHVQVAKRAIDRIAPFDNTGGGYRDTLIWLTALKRASSYPFTELTILSDDGVFFKARDTLEKEWARRSGGTLTVIRDLASLELPGEYDTTTYDLSSTNISPNDVADTIKRLLPGQNISQWSPPGPDHAAVARARKVWLDGTAHVKRRHGTGVYEISTEALAEVEADLLFIDNESPGTGETRFSTMTARWTLALRWRGETKQGEVAPITTLSLDVRGLL